MPKQTTTTTQTAGPEPIATMTCRRSAKSAAKQHCKRYGLKEVDFTSRAVTNQIPIDEAKYGDPEQSE